MNPLQQYLDLYQDYSADLNLGTPGVIPAMRADAVRVLEKVSELDSEVSSLLAPDYGLPVSPLPEVQVTQPGDVFIGSLREFENVYPELTERYFGRLADMNNPVVALNTLLVRDAFVLYVRAGVRLDKPVQIVNRIPSETAVIAPRRLLVIMEEGAEAKLLSCDHSSDSPSLALGVAEIYLAPDATFDMYDLEETAAKSKRLTSFYMQQQQRSRLLMDALTLYNGTTYNEYRSIFLGKEAELKLYGMGICDENRKITVRSHIDHSVPDCKSNELFRFAADDRARCNFEGRILVREHASKSEAYQACRSLLNGPDASVTSRPELEIYNDDVKCSHGCAIGQLDELQLFYMQTRGISREEAKLMLRRAFMADVIDVVNIPSLRDRLHIILERRLSGQPASCECDVVKTREDKI